MCQLVLNKLTWFSFSCMFHFLLPLPHSSSFTSFIWLCISPALFWHTNYSWDKSVMFFCLHWNFEPVFCVHSSPGTAAADWGIWSECGASLLPSFPTRRDRHVQHRTASHRLQPHLWQQWVHTNKKQLKTVCLTAYQHWLSQWLVFSLFRFVMSGRTVLCLLLLVVQSHKGKCWNRIHYLLLTMLVIFLLWYFFIIFFSLLI